MVHTLTITQRNGQVHTVYIDAQDIELVSKYTWHIDSPGYAATNVRTSTGRAKLYMHRLLMNPGELHVDHINHNKLDNRRCNLRICTHAQNIRNTGVHSDSTSGYVGVSKYRTKYMVRCQLNGVETYHGIYTTSHAAAIVANLARRELHADFSTGNQVGNLHQLYYPELAH